MNPRNMNRMNQGHKHRSKGKEKKELETGGTKETGTRGIRDRSSQAAQETGKVVYKRTGQRIGWKKGGFRKRRIHEIGVKKMRNRR